MERAGQVMRGQVGGIVKTAAALIVFLFAARADASSSASVIHAYAAGVPVVAVLIDLNSSATRITGAVARGGSGHVESWSGMIKRTQPLAAITGAYFDIKSKIPVGEIRINGVVRHGAGVGTAFCVAEGSEPKFINPRIDSGFDCGKYDYVVQCGPRLVADGMADVHAKSEGFADPALQSPTGRLGIGITKDRRLILAGTRRKVSLAKWAKVMKALGAENAMNLDAGPCMGLYANGQTIIQPKCELTNLVLVCRVKRLETAMNDKKREKESLVASVSAFSGKP